MSSATPNEWHPCGPDYVRGFQNGRQRVSILSESNPREGKEIGRDGKCGSDAHDVEREHGHVEGQARDVHDRLADVLRVEDRLGAARPVGLQRALRRGRHDRVCSS